MDDKIGISGEPSWNEGFSLMSKGTGILMHKINESVHHFPYVYMMIIIAFTIVFSYWKIGEARSERDFLNHTNYILTQKVDSMKNMR
jgi:hypothetical protein